MDGFGFKPIEQETDEFGFKPADHAAAPLAPEGKGFRDVVGRIGKDNPLSVGLQSTAAGANVGSDVMGKVIENLPGLKAYQRAAAPGSEKIAGGIEKVMSTPAGKAALDAAKKGGLAYVGWAKENPEAARDVEAFMDIGKFIAGARMGGEAAVKGAVKGAGELTAISPIMKGVSVPGASKLEDATQSLYRKAHTTIEGAKKSQVNLTANLPQDIGKEVSAIEEMSTAGDRVNAPKADAAIKDMVHSIEPREIKNAKGEKELTNGDLSLRNLLGHRQKLDSLVSMGGAEGIAAKKASQAIDKIIDRAVKNDEFIGGDKDAAKGILKFKDQWTKFKQHETLVDAIKEAGDSSAAAKKSMKKVMDSPFFDTYPDEAKKYIKQAAKGKVSGNVLDAVGKLNKILGSRVLWGAELAGALLHNPALIVAPAAVYGAESAGRQITKGTIYDALKAIQK